MFPDVLALAIPVLALTIGLVAVWRMPKEAFLPRAKHRGGDDGRIDELEQQLADLRDQLAETQERLDFTERALSDRRTAEPLPRPDDPITPPFITPAGGR